MPGTTENRTSRRITRQAHAAAVRLYGGDLTESERSEILARCGQDPAFKARFVEAHHLLGALDDWRDELREDSMYRSFTGNRCAPARRRRPGYAAGVALAVGFVLAVAALAPWTGYFKGRDDGLSRYETAVGKRQSWVLSDGTTIALNTSSRVLVEMRRVFRRVVMDRGEVYVEIAADPLRPFTVEVGGRSVTAHGTEFNLRRSGDGFTVALIDGHVVVHRQGTEAHPHPTWLDATTHPAVLESTVGEVLGLRPGTVLDFDARNQSYTVRRDPHLARRHQWRQGRLSFADEPMSTVIEELSRYSDKPITIHDAPVGDIRVFATLRLDSIDNALSTLAGTVPIRVVPTLSGIAILAADDTSEAPRR